MRQDPLPNQQIRLSNEGPDLAAGCLPVTGPFSHHGSPARRLMDVWVANFKAVIVCGGSNSSRVFRRKAMDFAVQNEQFCPARLSAFASGLSSTW